VISRINEILNQKKLTPSQFADAIGIQRSGMSHLLSGRNKPSLEFILKTLKAYPDIDPVWLLLGRNEDQSVTVKKSVDEIPDLRNNEESDAIHEPPAMEHKIIEPEEQKRIVRIVLFYADKSFDTYQPG
jgi:transcriptional regulator with XRE-family HTH domain